LVAIENDDDLERLCDALNDIDRLKELLVSIDPNVFNESDQTALGVAVAFLNFDAVETLLAYGADPNFSEEPALLHLCRNLTDSHDVISICKMARLLLSHGANVNLVDTEGCSALIEAASEGSAELVSLLIDSGASVSIADNDGWTALHYAAMHDHDQVIQILIEHGANVNCLNIARLTPLVEACAHFRFKALDRLLLLGADPTICDEEHFGAVDAACDAAPNDTALSRTPDNWPWINEVVQIKTTGEYALAIMFEIDFYETNANQWFWRPRWLLRTVGGDDIVMGLADFERTGIILSRFFWWMHVEIPDDRDVSESDFLINWIEYGRTKKEWCYCIPAGDGYIDFAEDELKASPPEMQPRALGDKRWRRTSSRHFPGQEHEWSVRFGHGKRAIVGSHGSLRQRLDGSIGVWDDTCRMLYDHFRR